MSTPAKVDLKPKSGLSFREDAWKRVFLTIGALIVFRLVNAIPLPGLELTDNLHLGSNTQFPPYRQSIFALWLTPILSAMAIFKVLELFVPPFARWRSAKTRNGRLILVFTVLVFAALQALGIAQYLENMKQSSNFQGWVAAQPGPMFELGVVATFVGTTAFIFWLAEQVTRRGVANGVLLFWTVQIALNRADGWKWTYKLWSQGAVSTWLVGLAIAFDAIGIALLIFVMNIRRKTISFKPQKALKWWQIENGEDSFTLVWPIFLAPILAGYIWVAMTILDSKDQHQNLIRAVYMVAIIALIFLLTFLQQRANRQKSSLGLVWPIGAATAVLYILGEVWQRVSGVPVIQSGLDLVIIVAVASDILKSLFQPSETS